MRLRDLMKVFEKIAPKSYACEWDNVGLLVGDKDKGIKKVYVALDCDDYTVEEAIKCEANLILTHHPLIFSPLKRITADDFVSRRIMRLIRHKMGLFAMHTNFDVAHMSTLAGEKMQLNDVVALEPMAEVNGKELGLGVVGDVFATELDELSAKVKDVFGLDNVKVFGDRHHLISRIAVVPGSGKSEIDSARLAGADVLITGDIDHHSGIDAVAKGLAIIDAGHYGIEHIFVDYVAGELARLLEGEDVEIIAQGKHEPFRVL